MIFFWEILLTFEWNEEKVRGIFYAILSELLTVSIVSKISDFHSIPTRSFVRIKRAEISNLLTSLILVIARPYLLTIWQDCLVTADGKIRWYFMK